MIFRGLKFCLNYFIALICTFALLIGIEMIPGLSPGYYALLILPLLVVSTIEGQHHARQSGERPKTCQACFAALQMVVLAGLVAKGFYQIGLALMPALLSRLEVPAVSGDWYSFALFAVVAAAVLRIGFAFGLATELKGQQISNI